MAFAAVTSGTARCLCERLDVEGEIGLSDSLLELYIFVFCLFIYGLITVFFVFFCFCLSFMRAITHSLFWIRMTYDFFIVYWFWLLVLGFYFLQSVFYWCS